MKHSIRFSSPIHVTRPRGARLLEAYSPKLGRRVQLYDRAAFAQWIRLEADPDVLAFCERPTVGRVHDGAKPISFWTQRCESDEEFLILDPNDVTSNLPPVLDGIPVRTIASAELVAAGIWIENWQRMLPVITAARDVRSQDFTKALVGFVDEPMALSRIERQFSKLELMQVRAAVFDALRTGVIAAPALRTERLGLHTLFEPVP